MAFAFLSFKSQQYQKSTEVAKTGDLLFSTTPKEAEKDYEKNAEMKYFKEEILPKYSSTDSKFSVDSIKDIFVFTYKDKNHSTAYLIEIDKQKQLEYYLITNYYQKKLEHPMTSSSGDDAVCNLDSFKTIGNEGNFGRDLLDKAGYIILTGSNCQAYGGGSFVSVYSLSDGKKIPLQGSINISHTIWNGITKHGNAQGRLVGVYGINQPQIIIKFGGFEHTDYLLEVSIFAFFDLQTGKLLRTIEFK